MGPPTGGQLPLCQKWDDSNRIESWVGDFGCRFWIMGTECGRLMSAEGRSLTFDEDLVKDKEKQYVSVMKALSSRLNACRHVKSWTGNGGLGKQREGTSRRGRLRL